ncbi:MAG: histone deacetylase [Nocardioidaceae bacterium]
MLKVMETIEESSSDLVWYAAYGSNLQMERFLCYLEGGCPAGARRTYLGSRNSAEPLATAPVSVTGEVFFAGESRVWTGGIAAYDPEAPGKVAARGYLLTSDQFSDVVAQEARRPVGEDLDLDSVEPGQPLELSGGYYDTVVQVGHRGGYPMLTLTAGDRPAELTSPAPGYLSTIAAGLGQAHRWGVLRIRDYLEELPGVSGHWTADELDALLEPGDPGFGR